MGIQTQTYVVSIFKRHQSFTLLVTFIEYVYYMRKVLTLLAPSDPTHPVLRYPTKVFSIVSDH